MPGCVGECTYYWDEGAGAWYPGGFNTCESGCTCGPPPGQEGPYDGYVATVACEGTPSSTTTSSSSSSSSTTSSTTTSSSSSSPPTTTTSSSSSSSSSSSTTTSSSTSSTTTSTTSTPCESFCVYNWTGSNIWQLSISYCVGDCFCPGPPSEPGTYYGQEVTRFCTNVAPTTTTTTTSTSTSTTSTAPPTTTTTTTGTGTTTSSTSSTSSTTTTTTTEQPCTGSCTWRWYAELQKWIKVSGGNGTCSTGCSCSYPAADGTTDGETATPACKRLTCTKCCGIADCCPLTCCTIILPKTLFATFNLSGIWDCLNGYSLQLNYDSSMSTPSSSYYGFRSTGLINESGEKWTQVIPCDGIPYYRVGDCSGPNKYDCNRNLFVRARLFIQCFTNAIQYNFSVAWLIYGKQYFATTCIPAPTVEYNSTISNGSCSFPIYKIQTFDNSPYDLMDPCDIQYTGMGRVFGNSARTTWTATITE